MPFDALLAALAAHVSVVKLAVDGVEYSGWYEVDIDSDIFLPADAFRFSSAIPKDKSFLTSVREGVNVDVYIDDDRQMAGVIDEVEASSTSARATISVSGRDKGAFLTDSEAEHVKASEYTLESLALRLVKPEFGIRNIIISNEDNRKLLLGRKDKKSKAGRGIAKQFSDPPRFTTKIDPGTRIASVLDERTRQLGVTWWITAQGDLFIGKPDYDQEPAYEFRCYAGGANAQTNNCEITVQRSISGRYSGITMVGHGSAKKGAVSKFKATAIDPDLQSRGIRRDLIVIDNDVLGQDALKKHVDFDMATRRLQGLKINITYPSLRYEENDRLFAVDTLAKVIFEEAGIDGVYYVTQRQNLEDAGHQQTKLTLHEKGVWLA